ncbi:DNA-processing protein DprA [Viridibacillus arvi]|uniref:DNA-processing protein DprA n=1 Tax=Viridibacillus arvi TaxID=263475 RepID=UPI00187B4A47|nr:DNA-processing protein DprA [Viridibacillus sp. JNUCC-6]QOV11040.1 DNA-protecting protein DprA [Viridibacillus sp. JNUCC-6]
MTELSLILALQLTDKLGEKTLLNLLKKFPDLTIDDLIYNQEVHKSLRYKSVIEKVKDIDYLERKFIQANKVIEDHSKNGIEILTLNSPEYPELLKLIADPPVVLYCKGNIGLLKNLKNVAVIGTREPTQYGEVAARKLARKFASEGYTIVSGLAKGIDTFGHLGALEAENGKTIAVMAGSLDRIYPSENKGLADKILLNQGLLISEIGIGQRTNKGSFVKRDRIQSGLSLGVCPVQAPLKSGTHHTINYAKLQKRLVFCPTPIEEETIEATQGIYALMKETDVFVIRDKADYIKLYSCLNEKANRLLGSEYVGNNKSELIHNYETQLDLLLRQGVEVLGDRQKLREVFEKIFTRI